MAPLVESVARGAAEEAGELDLESIIREFLADDSRTTLGLPHMTTGQRKHTKKLVERHPGLRCESFGLGQERQLHLFKASDGAPASAAGAPPAAAATSPPKLEPLSPQGAGGSAGTPQPVGADQHWETAVTECSTSASTTGSPGTSPRGGIGKPPGLDTPLGVAAVRNTFIHFDFEGSRGDDRQVQSMPHGMFRQRLWAEALSESVAEEVLQSPSRPPAVEDTGPVVEVDVERPALPEASASPEDFPAGTEVEICGLSKCPAFNGRRAIVQSYDQASGRYDVVLWSAAGEQRAKVRRENLRPVAPMSSPVAAPCFAPAAAPVAPLLLATPSPAGMHVRAR